MTIKKMLTILFVPVFAMIFSIDQGYARDVGFDDKEIRIGQWGPQTGPAAPWGAVARGTKLLFDVINEEGGIHGRKINYFIRDDQYNPSQTMAAVRDLVDRRGVFAFVGGVGTAPGLAVQSFLRQNEIVWVGVCTGARAFRDNPWLWQIWPDYFDEGAILAIHAAENLKFKKIAYMYQNDDWGADARAGIEAVLKRNNVKLLAAIPVEPTERDLSSQIARLKATGAEAVIGIMAPTQAAIALRTSVSVGFKTQWLHSYNLCDFPLMNQITEGLWAREGVMTAAFTDNIDADTPIMNRYREAAKRLAPKERWGLFYTAGIAAAEPLVWALQAAGKDLSKEKVRDALNAITKRQGIGPVITWTKDSHLPPRQLQIWQCGPKGETIVVQNWKTITLERGK
jgi:ABC-type branched-subunit amino acid transport system substrate-binding protein